MPDFPARQGLSVARLRLLSAGAQRGWLCHGPFRFACAIGRSGLSAHKREGDGATPWGRFALRHVYWRPDRLRRPATPLPATPIDPALGWCDGVGDRTYNRAVRLPYPASHERMWRDDGLYDVVVQLSHNWQPRVQGFGSAVFLHVASPGYGATAGCLALSLPDLLRLLRQPPGAIDTRQDRRRMRPP
jgi:L,D-peptidoglycan transpeptidase YkuD (ErfK/YbiS/YcfS/YnhG family)